MIRRPLSALRRSRQVIGSALRRMYIAWAYPDVRLGQGVVIGRGARLRAFDGGEIEVGDGTHIADFAIIEAKGGRMRIGQACHLGYGTVIVCSASIDIGKGTLIGEYATLRDQDHRYGGEAPLADQGLASDPVRIGQQVWLGAKATVTAGSQIADHVVVGANAVVTGSLTVRGLYAGVPARLVR